MIFPSPAGFCCCGNSMLVDVWSTRSSTGLYGSENKSSTQPCYRTYQNLVLTIILIYLSSILPAKIINAAPVYLPIFRSTKLSGQKANIKAALCILLARVLKHLS